MGYDLHAIKPEHWDDYKDYALNVMHEIRDDWYKNEEYPDGHRIWRIWRDGYLENDLGSELVEVELPDDLKHFYMHIHTSYSAYKFIEDMKEFMKSKEVNDPSMEYFLKWVEFWSDKDAVFVLSL